MRPVLVAVDGEVPKSNAQIRDVVAPVLGVSDEDRQVMLQAGLLARPERGGYLLTERGREVLHDHPDRVDMTVLSQFPLGEAASN